MHGCWWSQWENMSKKRKWRIIGMKWYFNLVGFTLTGFLVDGKKNVEFQSKKNVRFSMFKENSIVGSLLKHYLPLPTNHCAVLYAWTENIAPTHWRKTHNLTHKTLKSLNFSYFRINITSIYNRNLKEERESLGTRENFILTIFFVGFFSFYNITTADQSKLLKLYMAQWIISHLSIAGGPKTA